MKLLRRKSSPLLGIHISSNDVKVLELTPMAGQYRVESFGVAPIPGDAIKDHEIKNPTAIVEAVRQAVWRSKTLLKQAAVSVSSSSVITQQFQLASELNEKELEAQLAFEASGRVPYPMSEVYSDFQILGPSPGMPSHVDVLLVASRMEQVDVLSDILIEANLQPRVVDVECYALARASGLLINQLPNKGMDKNIVMIDLGSHSTGITILRNLEAIYMREETFDSSPLRENIKLRDHLSFRELACGEKHDDLPSECGVEVLRFFREGLLPLLRRTLQFFYSTSTYCSIDHIMLVGSSAFMPGLRHFIKENMGMESTIANPFAYMSVAPSVDRPALTADAPALMVCCGLAMRSFDG